MALTTIKTGGLADNSVTDAKVADAITVTGAQTGITQVGTLTAGTWNGTAIASAYLDADTAHLSGTQIFSGAKTFSSAVNVALSDASVSPSSDADDLVVENNGACGITIASASNSVGSLRFADSGASHAGMIYYSHTSNFMRLYTSATQALEIDSSQNATFAGNLTVNGTGSDIITGDYLYLDAADNSAAKNLVFRQLNDTWMGQIEFSPSGTSQIVTRVAQPLALGANNTQILKLRHETNQWGAEITSQSPYGLHVHTTGTSSGHDALKVSRHDDAIIFQVFADASTINKNALTVQGTGTSSFAGQVNVTNMVEVTIPDISTGENKGLSLKNTSSGTTQQWNITTGITGQENDSFCVRDSTNNVNAFTMTHTSGNANFVGNVDIGGRVYNSSTGGFYMNDGRIQNTITANSSGYEVMMFDNTTANGTVALLQYRTNATAEGSIIGNSSGLSISNVSDYRKKERITDLENSLDAINSLKPREYYYREEFAKPTRAFAGFIAHEVQESQLSHLTTGSKDGVVTQEDLDNDLYSENSIGEPVYQTVAYSDNEMITRLVGAVQELSAKVEALENA